MNSRNDSTSSSHSLFVTGFLPFGDNEQNPARDAAIHAVSLGVQGEVLPVVYETVDAFFDDAGEEKRRYLLFGLAAKRKMVRLERFAYNETKDVLLDMEGKKPPHPFVLGNGEKILETSLDIASLQQTLLGHGVPCDLSEDPGRYLCNYAYYRALNLAGGEALFVHLPPLSKDFDETMLKKAVAILVEELRK